MPKTFTDKPLNQFDQVKTDNITTNLDKYLDEFNGGLDSNNLPIQRITDAHLQLPVIAQTDVTGLIDKYSSKFPTQAYYNTKRDYNDAAAASDIYDPILTVDPDKDFYNAGFNKFSELDTSGDFDGFPLQFDAKEGMLIGCAVIDWEHGNDVYNVDDGGGNFVARGRGNDWWTEFQVYVNDIPVCRSGKLFPKRHTLQLPFAVPCGSQPVQIDCRVKINSWYATGAPSLDGHATEFKIFSARIWTRNQYR